MQAAKFNVGDKVQVMVGGWGMHPDSIGRMLHIADVTKSYNEIRYRVIEEPALLKNNQITSDGWVHERTFKLVTPAEVVAHVEPVVNLKRVGDMVELTVKGNLTKEQVIAVISAVMV